jgi:parvulin-like peptidyl-prolyl isomerase
MRSRKIFLILSIAALLVVGCSGKKEPAGKSQPAAKVLAKVNGTSITEDDLRLSVRTAQGMAPENEKLRALDDVIQAELLYQEGLKLGLDKDPGYLKDIAIMEKQFVNMKRAEITRRFYNTQIAARVEITNQEAQEYYNKNVDQIQTELHFGMIGFSNKEDAEAALKRIRSGEPFKQVAAANAPNGLPAGHRPPGDMGFVAWGQIPDEFWSAIYKLKPGEVSDVVSSKRTGFHIFTLLESRKNSKVEFSNMSGLIMTRLRDKKIMEAFESYLEKLKKDAKIEKF